MREHAATTESNMISSYEKCPKMVKFMLEEKDLDNNQMTENGSFQEQAEAAELVKTGFEYVTGKYSDGGKIFRKRV